MRVTIDGFGDECKCAWGNGGNVRECPEEGSSVGPRSLTDGGLALAGKGVPFADLGVRRSSE